MSDGAVIHGARLGAVAGLAGAVAGHLAGSSLLFFGGLLAVVAALAVEVWAGARQGRTLAPRLALAALSVGVAFLTLELAWAVAERLPADPARRRNYRYDEARADRAGFLRWWRHHLGRWARLDPRLVGPDPRGLNPYVLIPGATLARGGAELRVNRLGFRGEEIEQPKGERFRIVALGESTTFGLTVFADDRSWPEALEAKLAEQLECDLPLEVINAGVPGWTLANQVRRLSVDVFPLEPDLLLTYHGFNGFSQLFGPLPGLRFVTPADLPQRPSRLLGRIERILRLREIRLAQPNASHDAELDGPRLLRTGYAREYRELVEASEARGIGVALGSFNLAVDANSPEQVIRFYEGIASDARSAIVANRLHTRTVKATAGRSGAAFIDTSAGLDGAYAAAYVDLVHFTQRGRETLAANFASGLRRLLRAHPRLRCRPRLPEPS